VIVETGVGTEEYEAPSFRQIAARPGRDANYLRTFIRAPHYPMREQMFIPKELEEIVNAVAQGLRQLRLVKGTRRSAEGRGEIASQLSRSSVGFVTAGHYVASRLID
jgi:hypothetical protein